MSKSLIDTLADLPPRVRAAQFRKLSDELQAAVVHGRWEATARPEQLEPPGDWVHNWYIAGRGGGKGRAGAEWVHKRARTGQMHEGVLIGPTAADLRDVMIEGPSGIRKTAMDVTVDYEPSKRLLTWSTGAVAHTRSAEDPDSIRGLNVDTAWCFPAGTQVMTDAGEIPIERVSVGARVWTRRGLRRVTWSGQTAERAELVRVITADGSGVVCTPDHLFATEDGWVAASSATGTKLLRWTRSPLDRPRGSSGTAGSSIGTTGGTTGAVSETVRLRSRFTEPSGRRCTVPSPTDTRSTTSTVTRPTTPLTTSASSLELSISPFTRWITSRSKRGSSGRLGRSSSVSAPFAARSSVPPGCAPSTAAPTAGRSRNGVARGRRSVPFASDWSRSRSSARSAVAPSSTAALRRSGIAVTSAPTTLLVPVRVVAVEPLPKPSPVYDLTIQGEHEFVANGFIVHNCDEPGTWRQGIDVRDNLSLALRMGSPRCVWTTTPRRVPLIRDELREADRQRRLIEEHGYYEAADVADGRFVTIKRTTPAIVVRRWATYDNLANLAPAFAREILARYEGTRLGRQELYGELLEDVGTLFQRAWLLDRLIDSPDDARYVPWTEREIMRVRAWDFAATPPSDANPDPDWTVGTKLARAKNGHECVEDVKRLRGTPGEIKKLVIETVREDGPETTVLVEQEPGASGVSVVDDYRRLLTGHARVIGIKPTGPKEARASAVSSLAEQGRLWPMRGPWLTAWLDELEEFGSSAGHDDQVDTLSMAHNWLMGHGRATIREQRGRLPVRETHIPRTPTGGLAIPTNASRFR